MPFVPTIVSRKTAAIDLRALVADDVLEALEALRHRARLLLAPAVRVRVADDADDARLVRPAARVAGQGHRAERRPVVGAVAGEDLVAAGVVAGELDGVLDRLGAAEREEDLVQVAGQDLGQLRAEAGADLGREGRLDVLELRRLRGDRVDDPPVAVADVDRHQLAVEVEDPPALGRVEVDALGVVDGDRVDGALDGPREEGVLARERTISALVIWSVAGLVLIGHLSRRRARANRRGVVPTASFAHRTCSHYTTGRAGRAALGAHGGARARRLMACSADVAAGRHPRARGSGDSADGIPARHRRCTLGRPFGRPSEGRDVPNRPRRAPAGNLDRRQGVDDPEARGLRPRGGEAGRPGHALPGAVLRALLLPGPGRKYYAYTERIPDGPTTKRMQDLAKQTGMVLVVPMYEEDERRQRALLQHRRGHRRRRVVPRQVPQDPHPARRGLLGEVLLPARQPRLPGLRDRGRQGRRLHLLRPPLPGGRAGARAQRRRDRVDPVRHQPRPLRVPLAGRAGQPRGRQRLLRGHDQPGRHRGRDRRRRLLRPELLLRPARPVRRRRSAARTTRSSSSATWTSTWSRRSARPGSSTATGGRTPTAT